MKIIASSPRSGSTYLRFILCNLIYPQSHTFETVNRLIPTIESEEEMRSAGSIIFVKTHGLHNYASCFLHRHVEYKLVSEYFYQKHFYGETKPIEEWLEVNQYGVTWREFVNFYIGCYAICYDDLVSYTYETISECLDHIQYPFEAHRLEFAIHDSRKEVTSKLLPNFSRTDNYQLPQELKDKIREVNWRELKLLGYER